MALSIFQPAAVAVAKTIILGCRSSITAARVASKNVKFGMGNTLLELDGWTAAGAVAAWNESDNSLISDVTASLYTGSGWYQAVKLVSKTPGTDFRINMLIDDEVELLLSETHTITTLGKAGSFSFTLSLGEISVIVEDIDLTLPANDIRDFVETTINETAGIEIGDITVTLSENDTGYIFTLTYDGQFASQTISLPEIESSVLQPSSQATLVVTKVGSDGVDHEVELSFNVESETETSSEEQQLTPSTNPAPSTGDFVLLLPALFTTDPIPYNATASDIADAINSAAGSDLVTCTGGPINITAVRIAFTDTEDYPPFEVNNDGLLVSGTSPSAQVVEIVKGVVAGAGVNEVQSLTVLSGATGTLRLRSGSGAWSTTISATASAATVEAALEGILGAGNVSCTGGPLQTSAVAIEFTGTLAAADQPLLQIDLTSLTSGEAMRVEEIVSPGEFTSRTGAIPFTNATPAWDGWSVPNAKFTWNILTSDSTVLATAKMQLVFKMPWQSSSDNSAVIEVPYACTYFELWKLIQAKYDEWLAAHPDAEIVLPPDRDLGHMIVPHTRLDLRPNLSVNVMYGDQEITSSLSIGILTSGLGFRNDGYNTPEELGIYVSDWYASSIGGNVVGTVSSKTLSPMRTGTDAVLWYFSGASTFHLVGVTGLVSGNITSSSIPIYTISPETVLPLFEEIFGEGNVEVWTGSILQRGGAGQYTVPYIFYRLKGDLVYARNAPTIEAYVGSTQIQNYTFDIGGTSERQRIVEVSYIGTPKTTGRIRYTAAMDPNYPDDLGGSYLSNANFTNSNFPTTTPRTITNTPSIRIYNQRYQSGPVVTSAVWEPTEALATNSETTRGVPGGTNIYEQQRITFANTNGGTFTISDGTHTTADIAWNATASQVLSACTTASLPISTVVGNLGGPYTLTFSSTGDKALLTVDTSSLTNFGSSQPSVTVSTIRDGGITTVVGGLLGGTFDLRLTRGAESFMVLAIPYNVTSASLKTRIESVIGTTVTVTGGQLPDAAVTILFEDDVGATPWNVEVIPHIQIEGDASGTITQVIAPSQNLPLNVWDLEIIPGTDTPGLKDAVGGPDDWGYIVLSVVTPDGTLSLDVEPSTPLTEIHTGDAPTLTRYPSLIKIKWVDLTAHALERTINEALGVDCCRVTQPIQSIELEDFNVDVPVASGSGVMTERINCWYYRSVFRLSFFGRYADPDSLELAVQVPTYEDGTPISVKEFMTVVAPSDPDGADSLRNDVMGADTLDAALESVRIASAFYMAELGGEPLHAFRIVRSSSDGLLRWRFKLLDHYIIDTLDQDRPCYGIGRVRDCNVQFHWARVRYNEAAVASITVYGSTPMIPYDANAEMFQDAISSIIPGFFGTNNVQVLGKLYNSWLPDTYDPSFVAPDAPSNVGFNGLEVTLIGDLAYLPFDQYGLQLVMSIENRDTANPQPQRMFFYRADARNITRQDLAAMPMIHFETVADAPIPSTPQRTKLTFSDLGSSSFKIAVDGHEFELTPSTTATAFQNMLNTYFGALPIPSTPLPTLAWNPATVTWTTSTAEITATWLPVSFRLPVRVFGSTPAAGPFELLFRDYEEHQIGIGPGTYTTDPITITVITQGAYGQSTEWVLTLPSDATAGSIHLDDQTYSWPINLTTFNNYVNSEYGAHSSTTVGSVTTLVFDGTDAYEFDSFASALLKAGSVTKAKYVIGGVDGTLLTYELVPGAGPQWFTSKANWNNNRVPDSNDEIFFDDATGHVKYGIDQKGTFKVCGTGRYVFTDRVFRFRHGQAVFVTFGETSGLYWINSPSPDGTFSLDDEGSPLILTGLGTGTVALRASVEIAARYNGQFGLAQYRSSIPEYLPKYLTMDFTYLTIGSGGDGDGLDLGRFNTGSFGTTVTIHTSADGGDYPSIQLLADNSDTNIIATNASVGICTHLGESSEIGTFTGNRVSLYLGRNLDHGDIINNDGETVSLDPTFRLS